MKNRSHNPNSQVILWSYGAVIFLVSIALEIYGRRCGFILVSDSLQYLSAAKSFVLNGDFRSPDGSYYSYWPPLFPFLLSQFDDPITGAIGFNVISKVIFTASVIYISNHVIRNFSLKLIFIAAATLNVQMIMVSVFLFSELVFMALLFLNIVFIIRWNENPKALTGILITGFLLCVQRNAGLFWVSGISLWILLDHSIAWRIRITRATTCFMVCTSGLWLWNIYNTYLLPADFNFYHSGFFEFLLPNLSRMFSNIGKMLIYGKDILIFSVGVLFVVVTILARLILWTENRIMQFFCIASGVYLFGYLSMPGELDVYELDRYFLVLVPMVYLVLMVLVDRIINLQKGSSKLYIYLVMIVWLTYPVTRTVQNVNTWNQRSCNENPYSILEHGSL